MIATLNRSNLARLFSKVVIVGNCWQWTGSQNYKGYGLFAGTSVHRATFEWFVGPIPEGLQIDHLCRNTLCVNPTHLEAVTLQENRRRAALANAGRCKNGHLFTERMYAGKPWACCPQCRLASRRAWLNRTRRWRVVEAA